MPVVDEKSGRRLERYIRGRWGRDRGGISGLCTTVGVARESMYAWFRGDTDPTLEHLRLIAEALGVSRAQLLAAMDGEASVVPIDGDLERLVEERVEAALRLRLGPRPS